MKRAGGRLPAFIDASNRLAQRHVKSSGSALYRAAELALRFLGPVVWDGRKAGKQDRLTTAPFCPCSTACNICSPHAFERNQARSVRGAYRSPRLISILRWECDVSSWAHNAHSDDGMTPEPMFPHSPPRFFFAQMVRECNDISPMSQDGNCCCYLSSRFALWRRLPATLFGMASKLSSSTFYGERAALCAWCAGQTDSAEAAALLRYLEQMWITVAEVAEIVEKNKSHQPLGDDPLHLSPE